MGMRTNLGMVAVLCGLGGASWAQEGPTPVPSEPNPVRFGAFVDTYYAFDLNQPVGQDRIVINGPGAPGPFFQTQPARHNEFNVNLAFIDAQVEKGRVRGRLALQAGNSVQANYALEPSNGQISGNSLSRHLQEAFAGYRLSDNLTVDAGIYFSHLGMESFVSRDNWAYTRSLSADNSPYYQTGVRFSFLATPTIAGQVHLINGWQTISESNSDKAIGTQLTFDPIESLSVSYNTFLGVEGGRRIFNDFIVKYSFGDRFQAAAQFDVGNQKRDAVGDRVTWCVGTLIGRYQLLRNTALIARVERFIDPHSAIIASAAPGGFNVWGASGGVDVELAPRLLWRSEFRGFGAQDLVFVKDGGFAQSDAFAVTSLSLSL